MSFIKRLFFFLAIFSSINAIASNNKKIKQEPRSHPFDIVFCLDLSGSTNGLIRDVREQLWTIINQIHLMQPVPQLRIGMVGFSRPSFGKEDAYVKVLCDLTNDFDSVAYELYKLKPAVEKGDQYVNAALTVVMNDMNWGKEKDNRKIIFIVGNGLTSMHGVDIIKTCEQLSKQKIIVNSLFVISKGRNQMQAIAGWRKIAGLTGGLQSEVVIGKKEVITDVEFDYNKLTELNRQLNFTYLYHGENGKRYYRRYRDLDSAVYTSGVANYYQRAWHKQTEWFQNTQAHWDLVDYIKSSLGGLEKINSEALPDSLQVYSISRLQEILLTQKDIRERTLHDISLLFKNNYNQTMHQKFLNHEFPDSNIFSRCVINLLLKQWK